METSEAAATYTATQQPKERANYLNLLANLYGLLNVNYRGEILQFGCVLVLAIIQAENRKAGNLCKRRIILSQFGQGTHCGTYLSILERNLLIRQVPNLGYESTIGGELLLRDISTDMGRLLNNKLSKRLQKKSDALARPTGPNPWTRHKAKPLQPETFEDLIKQTLQKPGINKMVRYALLRQLGVKAGRAKELIKQLEPLKHTERIKPVLADILNKMASEPQSQNTKG